MKTLSCKQGYKGNNSGAAHLLRVLGPQRFLQVQKAFGGQRIWIPKPGVRVSCSTCRRRDQCIKQWRNGGRSVAAIAKHLGISPKTVYRVIGGASSHL